MIDDDEKYEKPDVTEVVHALIIYALVVLVGFFLLVSISQPGGTP
jgi:hypothetical protein